MTGFSRLKSAVRPFVPPAIVDLLRRSVPALAPGAIHYAGRYPDWRTARAAATGYDVPSILEKALHAAREVKAGRAAYERDSVLFDAVQYSWPVLAALLYAASRSAGRLSVLDFGGAFGSSYHQNKAFLRHLPHLRWSVVEQPHFVAAGQAELQDDVLRFYASVEQCLEREQPNVWLLSGVVQYLEDPFGFLASMGRWAIPFAVLDRVLLLRSGATRITVQTVPPQIYEASYPCWVFNEAELEAAVAGTFDVLARFDSHVGSVVQLEDAVARYAGALVEKRGPRA